MRIAIVSRAVPHIGGREVIIEYLIENLKNNHSILLLTPDIDIKRKGIKTVDINQDSKRLEKILGEFKPDLINCHTFYFFNHAKNLSKALDVPLVSTFHGMFLRFYGKDYTSIIGRICDKSDAVTVVSRNYKKELISYFGINGRNIHMIRNGIPRNLSGKTELGLSKLSLDIPQEKKLVAVPARVNKMKGLEYLIGAAKKMKKDNFFFLVCSPLGRHDKLEDAFKQKLFKSFSSSNAPVRFGEFSHSDLQKIFNISDVCLLPSLMEGISISILEAMEGNCFVITTNVGGNSEVIKNGKNGYLIKPRSAKDIVDALRKFDRLPLEKRREMTDKAKKTVRTYFSEKKMIKLYQNLFSNIIKNMRISNDVQAVITKKKEKSFLFLVIKRFDKEKNENHYRLVKGGVKKGENTERALTREISEEVGINDIKKTEFLSHYAYVGGDVQHKVDVFIVWTDRGDDVKVDSAEEGGFTIKKAVWMTGEEAIKKLNFKEEKNLIVEALNRLKP